MLHNRRPFLSIFCILIITLVANAQEKSINIHSGFNTACKQLNGTWDGYFIDPSQLFGNGGPWPLQLQMQYSKKKVVYGIVNANKAPDIVKHAVTGSFMALCDKSEITKLYFTQRSCGHYAPSGIMTTPRMILAYLPYESAMNETNFLIVLTKSTSQAPLVILPKKLSKHFPKVQTCH